jgi:hypothetical protein
LVFNQAHTAISRIQRLLDRLSNRCKEF